MSTVLSPVRHRSTAPLAERVAATVATAAEELGVRRDGAAVRASVLALAREPLALHARYPVWPSPFTGGGAPVELSLKLAGDGRVAMRCVADVTDYRRDGAANVARYRDWALLVARDAGLTEAKSDELCRVHLDGAPASWPARAMHGLGYAGDGWSRGSVYFRTGWLDRDELARRLPDVARALDDAALRHGSPTAGAVEVMGYDFVPGAPVRWKSYSWVACPPAPGDHPDLAPAHAVLEALATGAAAGSRALMLQVAGAGQRLFLLRPLWGGPAPAATRRLLRALTSAAEVDLAPLRVMTRVAAEHGLNLGVALVAVGSEQGVPSATVYVWPSAAPVRRPRRRAADGARVRGREFLMAAHDSGRWGGTDNDGFVTAFVASMLLTATADRRGVRATCDHLARTYRSGWGRSEGGAPDLETTALSVSVLARAGRTLPAGALAALVRLDDRARRSPAATACALLALLEAACPAVAPQLALLFALVSSQRADGGWASRGRDEATTLWHVTHALRAYEASTLARSAVGAPSRLAAVQAIQRAAARVRALPAAREPRALAAWLGAWTTAVGDAGDPAVARAAATLVALQAADGRWVGRPKESELVTTAAAVGALQCVRLAGRRGP